MILSKEKIVIIDGSSLLYRAFYALPLLNTKEGIYTNGIYGFLTMLYKVLDEEKPEYLAVVLDKSGPTFRHEEYQDYKGNRQSTPSELKQQFPIVRDVLDKLNIKYLEMDRYEADDIAGTIAKIGENQGKEVVLVTGDKDYLQLATDKTRVYITKKGITEVKAYDRDGIIDEYGITPEELIDLKGLMGDKSDNIPGVPGIGEKTGLKLLKEYKTIEGIYENLDKVTGKKLKENLIENESTAYMSRRLGTIITDVPLEHDIEDFKIGEPNVEELVSLYEKLEFKSLIEKYGKVQDKVEREELIMAYIGGDEIKILLEEIGEAKSFAFKFLVDGDDYIGGKINRLAIKPRGASIYIIDGENLNLLDLKPVFEDEEIHKTGHNLKSDISLLFREGIEIKGIDFDSVVGQYLINPSQTSYEINDLSREYLGYSVQTEEELLGKGKKKIFYSDLEVEELNDYLGHTLNIVESVEPIIKKTIEEQEMIRLYYEVELPLVKVLASMEYYGFKVNVDELNQLDKEYSGEIESLTNKIYDLAGMEFNINSPKQLGEVLFDKLQLPVIKKTKTGYSTNAEVLEKLEGQHEIIDYISRYRQIVKLKSTYIDGLKELIRQDDGRIHTTFNQTVTTTGRISSTEPNLQNIPIRTEDGRKIRKAFVSDSGYRLVDADYSQIELRVLAHISEDPKFIEAFDNNEDIHTKTASQVFHVPVEEVDSTLRSRAKAVNFGIVYGISDYGLSRDLNISRKEAKDYIDKYLDNYVNVKSYMDDIIDFGESNGYVETILNRRRYIPELNAKNFNIKSFGQRVAMNTPIQGSAADIIKMAMVLVYERLKEGNYKSRLILQVHDELIVETALDELDEVRKLLKDTMENIIELKVPLLADVEVGDSWYDTK